MNIWLFLLYGTGREIYFVGKTLLVLKIVKDVSSLHRSKYLAGDGTRAYVVTRVPNLGTFLPKDLNLADVFLAYPLLSYPIIFSIAYTIS